MARGTTRAISAPGTVTDLRVVSVTSTSVTLAFTEVDDGTGQPAQYDVRYAVAPISWGSAPKVTQGTCSTPVLGRAIGTPRSCTVLGLAPSTTYEFQLVAYRGTLDQDAVFGGLANVARATTPPPSRPGTVTDLRVVSTTSNSATLAFTEVDDGTGRPAQYNVRYAGAPISWGSATDVAQGTCKVPMAGTAIGARRTCTVLGLSPSTTYEFQLVAYRGTLNQDAAFGELSNVVRGTTRAVSPPGTVTDVRVASVTSDSVTLAFTEVDDGTGRPAQYNVRYAVAPISWGSASDVAQGTCKVPMAGTGIGARRTCTVLGLSPSTTYEFQLVAYRGTLNQDAVFGGLSNVARSTTPAGSGGGGAWPHEPSGFTVIEETGWESGTLGNWYRIFGSSDKPITVERIADSPIGESRALQIGYNPGHVGGGGTELRYDIPAASRGNEIFVGYYVQVSPQWQGHSSGINKMLYLHDGGDVFSAMWYEIFGSGSSPLDLFVVNQSGSGPSGIRENVNQIAFRRGQWHRVEIYQKQGAANNGIVRVWVDGVLAIDRSDVDTRAAPVDNITISGIWGGVGDRKNQADYMRFDRIRVSARR
jgi:polysaccharide lyase-like protein/fibronectin type III domain protein